MFRRVDQVGQLDYVARQVARLMARDGLTSAAALELMERLEPEGRRAAYEQFRGALAGDAAPADSPLSTLWQLLATVRTSAPARVDQCVLSFVRHAQLAHGALRDVVRGLRASTSYSGALLAVLLVVAGLMEMFVVPSIALLYRSMDAQLPPLAVAVVGSPWPLVAAVLIGMTLWMFSVALASGLTRAARNVAPLPPWLRATALARNLARQLDDLLYLQYLAALLDGAVASETAQRTAAQTIDPHGGYRPAEPLAGFLDGAAQLGLLTDEINTQLDEQSQRLAIAADTLGRRLTLLLRLIVYSFIAIFVLAMYQPIFQLGSVV